MAKNYNMYNYGTSPRKLQPEYTPRRNPSRQTEKQKSSKNTSRNTHIATGNYQKDKKKEKNKLQEQAKTKQHRKIFLYIAVGFAILFAISYRNSQIDEQFSQIQSLKKELAIVQKENEQLEVNIENGSNLNSLEQSAKELLGMQKLTNKQSVYVSLPKVDYIEGNKN